MRNVHRRFDRYYIGPIDSGDFSKILMIIYHLEKINSSKRTTIGLERLAIKVMLKVSDSRLELIS